MDENKIEQVEAQAEEVKADEVEAPAQVAEEAPNEEVVASEAPAEEAPAPAEAPATVAEGCDCKDEKCPKCDVKKESEDDQDEKKVAVKEGLQSEHDTKQREEVKKEQAKDLLESLSDIAALKVADIVMESIDNLPIVEGMSAEEDEARRSEIYENGKILYTDVMDVLEEVVAGTTMELNGAQVEVKDFVGTGGKVGMGLPAGINPPTRTEDDESEKKVVIKAYHESADEIDYKSKYAESEALMDDLVATVEKTSAKYTQLVEDYNTAIAELNAYRLVEKYGITMEDATDLANMGSYEEACEALDEAVAEYESSIAEEYKVDRNGAVDGAKLSDKEREDMKKRVADNNAIKAGAKDRVQKGTGDALDKVLAEGKKEDEEAEKEEKKAEEEAEKEEVHESAPEINPGTVIAEAVTERPRIRAFSVFSNPIVEEKKARKAYSVFND